MAQQTVKPSCPKCESSQVLYRQRDDGFWCRRCGYEWPKESKG